MTPQEVTKTFIERISAQDVDGLYSLMSENHIFIDGGGQVVQGRETMRTGWQAYFAMMPDYRIECEYMLCEGERVAVFGKARGTYTREGRLKPENRWEIPAAWMAVVRDGKVCEWRVYADNDSVRLIIERESG